MQLFSIQDKKSISVRLEIIEKAPISSLIYWFLLSESMCLPVDKSVLLLGLLEEVHEFALMVCQVCDVG